MPRFSTSFDDDQHDWIEQQADDQNRSKADIVRQCIDAVRTGSHRTEPDSTDMDRTGSHHTDALAELADRVDDLEEQLADLDGAIGDEGEGDRRDRDLDAAELADRDPDPDPDPGGDTSADPRDRDVGDAGAAPSPSPSTPPTAPDGAGTDQGREDGRQRIEAVLEGWPPVAAQQRDERREAGVQAIEHLREVGAATASDFRTEVEPEASVVGQSPKTWWRNTAREALNIARDEGLVTFVDGSKVWHWVDDDG